MGEKTLIEVFADEVTKPNGHGHATKLYRLVAERVRTCMLTPEEARVIASWFDRLAAGGDPRKVFVTSSRGGRPRVDRYDVAWSVYVALACGAKPADAYKAVAKTHGLKPGTVRNIYARLKSEITGLHKN